MELQKLKEPILSNPKIFLFGPSGSGKTSAAMTYPKPLVVDLENGAGMYVTDAWYVAEPYTPETLRTFLKSSKVQDLIKSGEVKTVIIDSATVLLANARQGIIDLKVKRGKPGRLELGDHATINQSMKALWSYIASLPCTVIVTALLRDEITANPDGTVTKTGDGPDSDKYAVPFFHYVIKITVGKDGKRIYEGTKTRNMDHKMKIKNMNYDDGAKIFFKGLSGENIEVANLEMKSEFALASMNKREMIEYYREKGFAMEQITSAGRSVKEEIGEYEDDPAGWISLMNVKLGLEE